MDDSIIKTDLLVVGAGPAGAALACFLAAHGRRGIMISAAPGCADTPRAHITNMAALECLRDIGLDKACIDAAAAGHNMTHTRWCHSMAGEEYARLYSWGNDPKRKVCPPLFNGSFALVYSPPLPPFFPFEVNN
jgi:2-polyprenyl-6-methoxyphenol hydroxylase-like FAD-dependent oxidoreductase